MRSRWVGSPARAQVLSLVCGWRNTLEKEGEPRVAHAVLARGRRRGQRNPGTPEGLWMCTSWVLGRPLIPPVSG